MPCKHTRFVKAIDMLRVSTGWRLEGATSNSFPLIEHDIRSLILEAIFGLEIAGLEVNKLVVVEGSPAPSSLVFDESRVMAAPERCANVMDYSVGVVDEWPIHCRIRFHASQLGRPILCISCHERLLFWCQGRVDKRTHVQSL